MCHFAQQNFAPTKFCPSEILPSKILHTEVFIWLFLKIFSIKTISVQTQGLRTSYVTKNTILVLIWWKNYTKDQNFVVQQLNIDLNCNWKFWDSKIPHAKKGKKEFWSTLKLKYKYIYLYIYILINCGYAELKFDSTLELKFPLIPNSCVCHHSLPIIIIIII